MADLVTGAAGFIGSHLARALALRGEPVRALTHTTPLRPDLVAAGVEPVSGDITRRGSLDTALAGVRRVFHCAALASDWGDPAAFRSANVDGVANVLDAAWDAGADHVIHVSSTDVYGFPNAPVDESAPLRPRGWPYGDTKIGGEKLVWRAAAKAPPHVTVIRPANVYGVGSVSFVREIAGLLHRGQMIHLGCRQPPAGLCHVDNLVDVILAAADNPVARGRAYNVTDDSLVSWREFTDALADAIGAARPHLIIPRSVAYTVGRCLELVCGLRRRAHRPLLTRMAVEIFTTNQAFAIDRARTELGYTPRRGFVESLPEMVRWLQGQTT